MGGGTGKFAPEAGKARMRIAFFTRVDEQSSLQRLGAQEAQALSMYICTEHRGKTFAHA